MNSPSQTDHRQQGGIEMCLKTLKLVLSDSLWTFEANGNTINFSHPDFSQISADMVLENPHSTMALGNVTLHSTEEAACWLVFSDGTYVPVSTAKKFDLRRRLGETF